MPVSPLMGHFTGGFTNGVAIRGMPVLNTYNGNVFWRQEPSMIRFRLWTLPLANAWPIMAT